MNTTVYTVDQAADMIGCKPKTIEDRARSGDLPGILWGDGGWRFPAEAFHARLNAIALEQAEQRRKARQPKAVASTPATTERRPPVLPGAAPQKARSSWRSA